MAEDDNSGSDTCAPIFSGVRPTFYQAFGSDPEFRKWVHRCLTHFCHGLLGHIGYAVVPWKRRRGYATEALRQLLLDVRHEGLTYVEITTDPDNEPSRRVIEANGGVLVERFTKPAQYGGSEGLRFRIAL